MLRTGVVGVSRVLVLAFVLFASRTEADINTDVCDPKKIISAGAKTMPTLPNSYELGVLVTNPLINSSNELLLGTDGLKAYARLTFGDKQVTFIGDYKRSQMIKMTKTPPTSDLVECLVSDLQDAASKGQWFFGYNETLGPHPEDPGWVLHFNDFHETFTGKDDIMGIPCNRWEACTEVNMRGKPAETIGVRMYWSDPEQWTPVAGNDENKRPLSVPVLAETTQKVNGKLIKQQSYIFRYFNAGPPKEAFDIPEGVFCRSLSSEGIKLPVVPDYFSYDSEILIRDGLKDILLYQKHYFDDQLNLTRLQFSPVYDDQQVPVTGEKPNAAGQFTLIHDLRAGLSYLLDKNFGTCVVNEISAADVEIDPSVPYRVMRMTNPMAFLRGKDINYTYYEEKKERGIPASLFMGLQPGAPGHSATVYEFWFSAAFQEIEGEGMWTSNKPLKFSLYPVIEPEKTSVVINLFNFDVDRPDVLEYDITTCTALEERLQLHFSLGGRYDVPKLPNVLQFKHQILVSLIDVMLVSPLRIHNIQLGTTDVATIISFTLLGLSKTETGKTSLDAHNIPSNQAVDKLRTAIDTGRLVVGIGGVILDLPAVKQSLYVEDMGIPTTACQDSISTSPSQSQMPRWDKVYDAAVLVNDIQNKSSHVMYFGVAGDKAVVKRVFSGIQLTLIGDYNRRQLIEMTGELGNPRPRFCMTKSLEDAAKAGQWIFGYNTTGENGRPHPEDPGWVFQFNDFQEHYMGKSEVLGIPCDKWEACQEINFRDGHKESVGIKFYWSDPAKWSPATAVKKAVPVKVEMTRSVDNKLLVQEYVFLSYSNIGPSEERLEIPQGVYCSGLKDEDISVPKVPDYFSYDSEIIIRKSYEELVFYQKHYFDDKLKLSRMEFSPLLDNKPVPIGDKSNNTAGQLTQIHDFTAGLSYLINEDASICEVTPINANDEDVQAVSNSKVRMRNPMSFLNLEGIKYTYYQMKKVRDIPASQFMGLQKGDIDVVYEYWFSAPLDEIEGSGMWTTKKPLKLSIYPQVDPDNTMASVHTNIFNFDIDEPDILNYDISACTPPDQVKYLSFQLPVLYDDLMMPSTVQFKHQILIALVENMMVRPLRIHNIELKTDDKLTTVIFTLLMKPTVKGNEAEEGFNELSSDDAVETLNTRLNEGILIVGVPGGDLDSVTVVKDSLKIQQDRFSRTDSAGPIPKTSSGYSGGEMTALAIGMLLLGALLGLLVFVMVKRRSFKWPSDFEHKHFVNDQHEPAVLDTPPHDNA